MQLVIFRVGARSFGVPVKQVNAVIPIVAIDELPGAPGAVRGIIDIHGSITPVVDLQRRFSEQLTALQLDQLFVVVADGGRRFALLADEVDGVAEIADATIAGVESLVPGAGILTTVAIGEAGLTYIYDTGAVLSSAEASVLESALNA